MKSQGFAGLSTGDGSPTYHRLRGVLSRYASSITVDGILTSACARARVAPSLVNRDTVEKVVRELRAGVRIFCQPDQIPAVLQELTIVMRSPDALD